jgi:hypothetical protein
VFWDPAWDLEILVRRLTKQLRRGARPHSSAAARQPSHRHLAHIASRFPRAAEAEARQFIIIATFPASAGRPPAARFESDFDPL